VTDSELVRARIEESVEARRALLHPALLEAVGAVGDALVAALRAGNKAILFGNGGSAADASHLAAELVGRYGRDRPPLPALSLTDNPSSLTAIGNDYSFEETFARQVRGLGRTGDVAVGISTSGRSANVVAGIVAAREEGLVTVALTGAAGNRLAEVAELCIRVPSDDTPRVQEGHMLIGHILCELVERELFPD
jgi:D-sedoheptulose 7-phosphate isomerase